jgi:hypothetical protein
MTKKYKRQKFMGHKRRRKEGRKDGKDKKKKQMRLSEGVKY